MKPSHNAHNGSSASSAPIPPSPISPHKRAYTIWLTAEMAHRPKVHATAISIGHGTTPCLSTCERRITDKRIRFQVGYTSRGTRSR